MDEAALAQVQTRISGTPLTDRQAAGLEAALKRSHEQIEALKTATAELETTIPAQVGNAVRDGLHAEVLPVARYIAELRGLFNQANRRLARIESDLLAERKARIDDLALLVDLVSTGWRGVDTRLERLEAAPHSVSNGRVEKLPSEPRSAPAAPSDVFVETPGVDRAGADETVAA
ncbi:MAG: hypothetical protein H0U46_02600 [Actinobacteria bacterium]|nr:hypothetical protein [Actinomycetota bacterium]